ncbi:MAG: PKD domain-containing protein [Cyclobacteriaceae bacterium]
MIRLDYGADLSNAPTPVTLGNIGSSFNAPHSLSIISNGENWFGFVVNFSGNNLIRLDFGSSLANTPSAVDLGSLDGNVTSPDDIQVIYDSNTSSYYALICSQKSVISVNFGSDLESTPTYQVTQITGSSRLWGMSLLQVSNQWYGLAANFTSGDRLVYHITFDASLVPSTFESIDLAGLGAGRNRDVWFGRENDSYFGMVVTEGAELVRIDFDQTPQNTSTDFVLFGDIDDTRNNNVVSVEIVSDGSDWYGFVTDFGNSVYRLNFDQSCSSSVASAVTFEPEGVSYDGSGEYDIWLEAVDSDGNFSLDSRSVLITPNRAPSIELNSDGNVCVGSEKTFTIQDLSDPADVATTYEWDVNGDDIVDITQNSSDSGFGSLSVDYNSFGGAGTYNLAVNAINDGSCVNTVIEQVVLLEEPSAPTDIDATAASFCTFTEIRFTYPEILSLPEEAQLKWDINGEIQSDQDTVVFSFDTPGDKNIGLQVILSNCSTAVYSEVITLDEGPSVDFSYANNCFGEEVNFNNQAEGNSLVSFLWDFGDGAQSNLENPSHLYSSAGSYLVTLTVDNASGCSSSVVKGLVVNDQALAAVVFGESIENLPTTFEAIDQTLDADSIIQWSWDFDGLGSSESQFASFNFDTPGVYEIVLEVVTAQGCHDLISNDLEVKTAIFPTANFSYTSEVCLNEPLTFLNESVNATSYTWDFCVGDLNNEPETISIEPFDDRPFRTELIQENGEWYGILLRNTDKLSLLSFGNDLGASPSEIALGNPENLLALPQGLSVVQNSFGDWYAFITNIGTGDVVRLSFGSSIINTPVATSLGDFDGQLSSPRTLEVINDGTGFKGLIGMDDDKLGLLDFGNDLNVSPVFNSIDIPGANSIRGISVLQQQGQWFALASNFSNTSRKVFHISFGDDLGLNPTITEVDLTPFITSSIRDVVFVAEVDQFHGYVLTEDAALIHLAYEGIDDTSPAIELWEDIDVLNSNVAIDIEIVNNESIWSSVVSDYSGKLYQLNFPEDCEASSFVSDDSSPTGIRYGNSGDFRIGLIAKNDLGNENALSQVISVSEDIAPSILFTPDKNLCIANPTIWTSEITEGNVTTYSWDLDGDGVEDSSDPNPTFQYASPGVYDIRLDVFSDAGCTNYVEDEIELYPEPPVPVFEASASTYCTESVVTLTNLTDHAAYDGLVEYHWSITGLSDTTTTADLAVSFAESGVKTIAVYSAIPGCESVVAEQTIEIFDAPVTDFSATTVCSGELTAFTNLSETADYIWDFGDGIMSSGTSPEHFYASPGTYDVQLEATDTRGCVSIATKQVMVSPLPQVSFDYPQVCKGEAALFEDQSFVEQSDVIGWEWIVDDVSVATTQDASIVFETSGVHNVRLVALSQAGCLQSYAEDIEIEDTPDLLIESDGICLYNMIAFTDVTADQSNVQQRIWMVDGVVQSASDQTLTYSFSTAGVHEVQMIVDQATGCSGTTSLEIDIPENPQLNFVWDKRCDNEDVIFSDITSESAQQVIASRVWKVNGEPFGNGADALLPVLDGGTYEVSLEAITDLGCELTLIQNITLDDAPDIDFSLSNDYGVPPFSLSVSNQTQHATEYIWMLDGAVVSTSANPVIAIESEGVQTLKLVATGSSGCKDSSSTTINSALPIIDLRINEMQLLENGNANNILVNLSNLSNIPVETMAFSIELEDDFELPEQVFRRIEPNEQAVITLNTSIPADYGDLKYLCVSVYSIYDVDDLTPTDNESCQNLAAQKPVFEPPFPNPAKDQTVVKAVLPESGEATISVIDMSGQVQVQKILPEVPAGLNVFEVSLLGLDGGTYMIDIRFKGGNYNYRVIKQ